MVILLFKEEAKKACPGKPLQGREKERREKVLWSVLQSRRQRKVDGTIFGVILLRLSENSILMDEISEKIFNEELDTLFLVHIQIGEDKTGLSTTWRSRIWNEEIQRELESQRRQLLKANKWADQAQRQRIHLCCELETKNRLHQERYARSCQEIEELKRRGYQEENPEKKTTKIGIISHAAWSGITNTESILLRSSLTEQLWRTHVHHQALITSSSRKRSREVGMLRNTREDVSIPGNVFDRQHAQRVPEELHNDSRNLATPTGIKRREQTECRKVGAKNHCNQYLYLAFQGEQREKVFQTTNESYVYD